MTSSSWEPDKRMLLNGWHFYGIEDEEDFTEKEREELLERFVDSLIVESDISTDGKKYLEVYLLTYPQKYTMPSEPGGGFTRRQNMSTPRGLNTYEFIDSMKHGGSLSTFELQVPEFKKSCYSSKRYEATSKTNRTIWLRRFNKKVK